MATSTASTTVQYVGNGNPNGTIIGLTSTELVGFYGVTTPVARRANAAQATSTVATASSADVTTGLKAAVIEIMNTLTALGIWKGSA